MFDSIEEVFKDYEKLVFDVNNSKRKLNQLRQYIDQEDNFEKINEEYKKINNALDKEEFLLEYNLYYEYLVELHYYNDLINKLNKILLSVNLKNISYLKSCKTHNYAILNDKLVCINCFLNLEEHFKVTDFDIKKMLINMAKAQNIFVGEIDNADLQLIELLRYEKVDLISEIKRAKFLNEHQVVNSYLTENEYLELMSKLKKDKEKLTNNEIRRLDLYKLKMQELKVVYYEIQLLYGISIDTLYEGIKESDFDALCIAIDNLNNHKEKLKYFSKDINCQTFRTSIPKINQRILLLKTTN